MYHKSQPEWLLIIDFFKMKKSKNLHLTKSLECQYFWVDEVWNINKVRVVTYYSSFQTPMLQVLIFKSRLCDDHHWLESRFIELQSPSCSSNPKFTSPMINPHLNLALMYNCIAYYKFYFTWVQHSTKSPWEFKIL